MTLCHLETNGILYKMNRTRGFRIVLIFPVFPPIPDFFSDFSSGIIAYLQVISSIPDLVIRAVRE